MAVASRSSEALAMATSSANNDSLLSLTSPRFTPSCSNYTIGRLVWQRSNFEKPRSQCIWYLAIAHTKKVDSLRPLSSDVTNGPNCCLEHCGSARELTGLASPLCVYKSPHSLSFSSLQLLEFLYRSRSTAQEEPYSFQASCLLPAHLCAARRAPSVQ